MNATYYTIVTDLPFSENTEKPLDRIVSDEEQANASRNSVAYLSGNDP